MPENLSVFYFDPIHCLGFFRPWLVERGVSVRFRLGAQKRTNRAGLWPVVQAQPGGYSMLEVLVALGLTGIISMGLVKYMQHQSAQVSSLEVQSHSDKLYRYWENLLQEHLNARSTDACEVLGLRPGTDFADVKVSLESLKLDQLGFTAVGFEQGGAQEDEDENPLGDSPEGGVDDGNEDGRTVRLENDPPPPARKPTKQWVPEFGNWRAGLKHADLQLKKEDLELLAGGKGVRSVACLVPVDEEEGMLAACPYPFDESVAPWHSLAWGADQEGNSGGSEGEGDEGNIALDAQIYVRDYRVLLDIGVGGGDGTVEKLATAKQVFKFPLVLSTFQKQGGSETLMSCSRHSRVAACMEQGGRLLMQELPEGGVAENFVCDFRAQAFELNAGIELDVENYECPFEKKEEETKKDLAIKLCASGIKAGDLDEIENTKKCGCKIIKALDKDRSLAADDKDGWQILSNNLNKECNKPIEDAGGYSVEQCEEVKCEFGTLFQKEQLYGEESYSGLNGACDLGARNIYKGIERRKDSIFSNASCDAAKSMCRNERGPYGKGGFYPVQIFTSGKTALYQCVRCRNKKGQYVCPFYTGANKKSFHKRLQSAKSIAESCLSGFLISGVDSNGGILENEYLSSGDFYTLCEQDAAISGMDPQQCLNCMANAARYNNAMRDVLGVNAFEIEKECSNTPGSNCPCWRNPYGCPLSAAELSQQCRNCNDKRYQGSSWCIERYRQCQMLSSCNNKGDASDDPVIIKWGHLDLGDSKNNAASGSHFYTYECPLEILEDTNDDGVKEKNEFSFFMRVPAILAAKRLDPKDQEKAEDWEEYLNHNPNSKWGVALPGLKKGGTPIAKPFNPFPQYKYEEKLKPKTADETEEQYKDRLKKEIKEELKKLRELNPPSKGAVDPSYALGCYEAAPKNYNKSNEGNIPSEALKSDRWKDAKIARKFEQLLQQEYDLVFNFYKGNTFDEAGNTLNFKKYGQYKDKNGNETVDWDYIKSEVQVNTSLSFDDKGKPSSTSIAGTETGGKRYGIEGGTWGLEQLEMQAPDDNPNIGSATCFGPNREEVAPCLNPQGASSNCHKWSEGDYVGGKCNIDIDHFKSEYKTKGEKK